MDTLTDSMLNKTNIISIQRSIGNIHSVYEEICGYVASNADFLSIEKKHKFIEELKIIVYELYSNAVNFSTGETINIELNINDNTLELLVRTEGNGFRLKPLQESMEVLGECFPPFSDDLIGKDLTLYRDSDYSVIGNIEKYDSINFYTRQDYHRELNLNEVSEHFGLFLISVLSDDVHYYRYNDSEDVFTVRKKIS
ncbi:MAG: ATP-binding protein [Ignavibacteria bacterium]|nr:ATP-binding protein [Ignavibacteria bacterium]